MSLYSSYDDLSRVEVTCETRLPLNSDRYDYGHLINFFKGSVKIDKEDIGQVNFSIYRGKECALSGVDSFEAIGSMGESVDNVKLEEFIETYPKYQDENIFILSYVKFRRKYKGLKLFYYVMGRVLKTYGDSCIIALLDAIPLQSVPYEDVIDFGIDRMSSEQSLMGYYSKFGFKPVSGEHHHWMMLDLPRRKQLYNRMPLKVLKEVSRRTVIKEVVFSDKDKEPPLASRTPFHAILKDPSSKESIAWGYGFFATDSDRAEAERVLKQYGEVVVENIEQGGVLLGLVTKFLKPEEAEQVYGKACTVAGGVRYGKTLFTSPYMQKGVTNVG